MKHIYVSLIFLCVLTFSANAETWNGSTSTDWNTASNWTPATVPGATSVVTIPTFGITNYPQLSSNITIEQISMSSGAKLDVNGFVINILGGIGNNVFTNDTINNSAPGTNIIINVAATAGYSTRIAQTVFTDTIVFNITGSGSFFEGYNSTPNIFNHEVTYNISSDLNFYTSYISETNYLEGVSIYRTAVGDSYILQDGGSVAGDFIYTNNVGGESRIGSAANVTLINGTVDINTMDTTTSVFIMRRLKNLTTGGIINVQGSKGFTVQYDTLLVSSFSLLSYSGAAYAYFDYNDITGNLTISPDSTYAGGYHTQLRENKITGTTTISNPCINALYEAFAGGSANTFNGNTIINANGSGTIELSYSEPSNYNGNLTVNRTLAGNSVIFKNGGTVNGNFDYSNNTSGNSDLGNLSAQTIITGTININTQLTVPARFRLYNIKNQTTGGSIITDNTMGVQARSDTLLMNDITLSNYIGNAYAYIWDNHITGNLSLSSDSNYVGGYTTDLRRNTINGNTQITINSSNNLNEANSSSAANIFNGNLNITANGSGTLSLGYNDTSSYNGNVTIVRNVAGTTTAFGSGGVVMGNLSYTNNVGGSTNFGFPNYPTLITGTVDMQVDLPSPASYAVRYVTNQTPGGVIDIRGTQGFNFRNDSLQVASLALTEYTGNSYGYFLFNEIIGDLTISDDTSYAGGYNTDLHSNVITGNASLSLNSVNELREGYNGSIGNVFNGNTVFNANGSGALRVSAFNTSIFNGNVTVNRTQDGLTRLFEGGGIVNGNMVLNHGATGPVYFGANSDSTLISGTLDIMVNDTTPQLFNMRRVVNQTTGGVVNVQNSLGASIYDDTLKLASFTVAGYRGNAYANFYNNQIEGDVNISSDSTFVGGYYTELSNNTFIGNTDITNNGTNIFYAGSGTGEANRFKGNLNLTKGQGTIILGDIDTTELSGDLILNSANGISLKNVKFDGDSNAVINQLGTQDVEFNNLIIEKTDAHLTLNKKVGINDAAQFISGNIINDTASLLTFKAGSVASGASDSSHVEGVVAKIGNVAFTFPIGKNNKYAPLGISAPSNSADEFTAAYFEASPHVSGYDSSMKDVSIDHISQNEYWICDRTAGTSDVAVILGWDSSRSGIVNNLGDLLVCRWDGTSWKNEGQGSNTGSFANGTVTSNTVTTFSPFTLGSSTANNPLPITLVNFEVRKNSDNAQLFWTTENEKNIQEFVVERSSDGINFETIESISAKGFHDEQTHYEVFDTQPLQAINYYRLKIYSTDGSWVNSEIRALDFTKKMQASLYPNPVKNTLHINADIEIKAIEIYDVSGKIIFRTEDKKISELNMSSFDAGVYFIKIHQAETSETYRILKK